jgi:hypothetical protein
MQRLDEDGGSESTRSDEQVEPDRRVLNGRRAGAAISFAFEAQ